MADKAIDVSKLPPDVRAKLAELDLELSEGDITQKGYEKKRARLLAPYNKVQGATVSVIHIQNVQQMEAMLPAQQQTNPYPPAQQVAQQQAMSRAVALGQKSGGQGSVTGPAQAAPSPSTAAQRRAHRRLTREDNRYHSEIRTEAVMQALAMNKKQSMVPMPSKRTSVYNQKQKNRDHASDSSSDDDSIFGDDLSRSNRHSQHGQPQLLPGMGRSPQQQQQHHQLQQQAVQPQQRERHASDSSHSSNVSRSSAGPTPRSSAIYANVNIPPGSSSSPSPLGGGGGSDLDVVQGSRPQYGQPGSALADVIQISRGKESQRNPPPPDLTNTNTLQRTDRVNRLNQAHAQSVRVTSGIVMSNLDLDTFPRPGKVSAKIQQLLNTLKRPKKKKVPTATLR